MVRAWFCITVLSVLALPIAAQPANGRNVNMVIFGTAAAEMGSFRLSAPGGEWLETGVDHSQIRFRFRETRRDDWSVYLRDDSRRVEIQLDLHTKKVMYSDAANPTPRAQYPIRDASAKMNGWLVQRVTFAGTPGGSFTKAGQEWIERAQTSPWPRFRFRETSRDDWSVSLRDDSRKVDIRLDLHTGNIYSTDPSTPRVVLYSIQKSS
jgi:hypothetical protein